MNPELLERTRRLYNSPEDAATSLRHLVRELQQGGKRRPEELLSKTGIQS